MRKFLNLFILIGFCILVALGVLFFTDNLIVNLGIRYLFLLSCLMIFSSAYFKYRKRTIFDEAPTCLGQAEKTLRKINLNKKEKFIFIKIIRAKNYLSFAIRYLEDIIIQYDLFVLQKNVKEIKSINEKLSKQKLKELSDNIGDFSSVIDGTIKIVDFEYKKKISFELEKKKQKKQQKK